MIFPSNRVRIMVATKPIDFRKGHDSLAAMVKNALRKDPFTGTVFVFRARKADRLKLLYWDGTGLVMAYKRLEEHSFTWPAVKDGLMLMTGYFWALARDDRSWGGTSPPGVVFTYAPGRGGQHADRILQGFGGILQVDGYAGYNRLIAADRIGPGIQLAYCWAHARRKLIEITRTGPAPIAEEGVVLIRDLYAIEADIRGRDPATRLSVRQDRSAPILARLDDWLTHHRARTSAKSPLGEALAYIAKYRDGLGRVLTDGRVEIDNNMVERTIRPIALNRKNALFAGHDAGAENRAVIASLIETCKMNGVDPHAWLSATLTAIVKGHRQSQIDELLPWNYAVTV